MITNKLELIGEQTSPLFRIVSAFDIATTRRQFPYNILAFHIGNGLILTVAHNLRSRTNWIRSFADDYYTTELVPNLSADQLLLFEECFSLDNVTGK